METVSKKRGRPRKFTSVEMFAAKAIAGETACNRTLNNWCYVQRALRIGLGSPGFSAIVPDADAVEAGTAKLPIGLLCELGRLWDEHDIRAAIHVIFEDQMRGHTALAFLRMARNLKQEVGQ